MNNFKSTVVRSLKPYNSYIPNISKTTLRSILKVNVAYLEHQKYSKDVYDKEFIKISSATQLSQEEYAIMFTCITLLMEMFLKSRNVNSVELSDTLRELKFNDECIEDITKVLITNQASLTEHFREMKTLKPMDKFQFRINISLIESGQSPTIILYIERRGEIQAINLSIKHFHRFRLAVATILAEMYALEGKKIGS